MSAVMGSPIYHSSYRGCNPGPLLAGLAAVLIAGMVAFFSAAGQTQGEQDQVITEARALLQAGQASEALPQLRSYLVTHPDSAQAAYLVAYAYYILREPRLSLEQYTRAAKLRPPTAEDLMAVSADYILLEDYEDASKWLTRVTELDPQNALAWYYLGRSLYFEGKYPEATQALESALTRRPEFVRAETGMGLVEEATGKLREALLCYQTAQVWEKRSGNRDAQPYISAGELQLKQNQLNQALASMLEARSLSRNNPRIFEDLGRIYERLDRYEEAEAALHDAETLSPDASTLHFLRATALQRLGRKVEAEAEFQRTQQLFAAHSNRATENFDLHP